MLSGSSGLSGSCYPVGTGGSNLCYHVAMGLK
jgi:hypothetical protein